MSSLICHGIQDDNQPYSAAAQNSRSNPTAELAGKGRAQMNEAAKK
ncbi:hypothetical protein [Trinickia terrae]|nr:hypothetical protein [Trinickia terrae]